MSYNECPSSNNTECHSEKTAAFTKHWHHLNAGQQEKPGREVPRPFPLPQGTLSQDVHLPNSYPPLCLKSSRNGLSRRWGGAGCVSMTASSRFQSCGSEAFQDQAVRDGWGWGVAIGTPYPADPIAYPPTPPPPISPSTALPAGHPIPGLPTRTVLSSPTTQVTQRSFL